MDGPQELGELVVAARAWRDALIPVTSTATQPATRALVEAIARVDCEHPRHATVLHPDWTVVECSACGLRRSMAEVG